MLHGENAIVELHVINAAACAIEVDHISRGEAQVDASPIGALQRDLIGRPPLHDQHIGRAARVGDGVFAVAGGVDVEVVARPAIERIGTGTSRELVVAGPARQGIAAGLAEQEVVVVTTVQGVIFGASHQHVSPGSPGERVLAGFTE